MSSASRDTTASRVSPPPDELSLGWILRMVSRTSLASLLWSPVLLSPALRPCGGSLVNLIDICRRVMGKCLWTSVVIQRRKQSCTISVSVTVSISSSMKSSPSAMMESVGSEPIDRKQMRGVLGSDSSHVFSKSRITPSVYFSPIASIIGQQSWSGERDFSLRLRVNEEGKAGGFGDDDAILNGQVIIGEPLGSIDEQLGQVKVGAKWDATLRQLPLPVAQEKIAKLLIKRAGVLGLPRKFPAVMSFRDSCQDAVLQFFSGSIFTVLTRLWKSSSTQSMIRMMSSLLSAATDSDASFSFLRPVFILKRRNIIHNRASAFIKE
ncbi:hypothetical protein EYF80_009986 [Liparis tanakae]|uniref:Uncharacterized protein n=1 Tax=Liparis tanakae TaxID=230148 RepID=A0A4Z2IRD5_9TELE|nr:hypothetical protein EYF80_009986 [Liparis tanakae]